MPRHPEFDLLLKRSLDVVLPHNVRQRPDLIIAQRPISNIGDDVLDEEAVDEPRVLPPAKQWISIASNDPFVFKWYNYFSFIVKNA